MEAALRRGFDKQLVQAATLLPAGLPLLVHWGVDLMLPDARLLPAVEDWNRQGIAGKHLSFSTPTEHYQTLVEYIQTNDLALPVLKGEVPSLWPYQVAINYAIKGWEIHAIHNLLVAESIAAISTHLGLRAYPHGLLDHVWKRWLEASDHNLTSMAE